MEHSLMNRPALTRVLALSVLILSAVFAKAAPIFGIDNANNLVRFDSATPGTLIYSRIINGIPAGEIIVGLDVRPEDGRLYALTNGNRLYIIRPTNLDQIQGGAFAFQVGTGTLNLALNGSAFGFDFDPTIDRIRVVSNTEQNLRLNADAGTVVDADPGTAGTQSDTNLFYAIGDPNEGANPNVVAAACTNNIVNATTTTLYGIDSTLNILVRQGGNDGTPSPNTGQLFTIGSLGVDVTEVVGFDIESGTGTAYATMVVAGIPQLYTINLSTGLATLVGNIASGTTLRAMTVWISSFTASRVGTIGTFTGTAGANQLFLDEAGSNLRHNRFSEGDAGFNSDIDFDSSVPGDQTLSESDAAVTIIVNAGDGDDYVFLSNPSFVDATFQINGEGGGDRLEIRDSPAASKTINLNGATSTVSGMGGLITYGTLEVLDLDLAYPKCVLNISGTAAARTTVRLFGGGNTVNFADGATLSGGFLAGNSGNDTLNYSAYTTPVSVDSTETYAFFALLSGMQEADPLSSSQGSGNGVFRLNAAETALSFNISFKDLEGSTITGEHFHNASVGENGPIVRALTPAEMTDSTPPDGAAEGVWSSSDPVSIGNPPSGPLTPALVSELLSNRVYFNLHTNLFPSGELRGQLRSIGKTGRATGTGAMSGFEHVTGGSAGDYITGDNTPNTLRGGGGDDTLVGGHAGDQLFGGDGNDTLVGGPGSDGLFGEAGDDLFIRNEGDTETENMEGGAGTDTVQVNGSPSGGDQFLIQVNPADPDPTRLRFDRTNLTPTNFKMGSIEALEFNTLGGNDITTVEFAGGTPIPVEGIDFDGGTGSDRLVLQRSAGTFAASSTIHTATGPGSGTISVDGRVITYTGLEPVDDSVPSTNLTFIAPMAATHLQVVNGPTIAGFATTQINDGGTSAFELVNFARKTNVTINAGTVGRTIVINNSVAPPDLSTLTINASSANDDIDIIAVPPGVTTTVNSLDGSDEVTVTGAGLPSGTTLFLDTGAGSDRLIYEAGDAVINRSAGPNPGQTTITRPGSGTLIFQNSEEVTINGVPPRALNISARLRVLTGDNVLIGGFIISGSVDKKVIMRAIGPSLAQFGLTGLLDDPTLELYDSNNQLIGANDNWRTAQESEISNSGFAPQHSLESALIATLAPGHYTVVVRGKDNTSGIGVVEVYDLEAQSPAQLDNISSRGFVDAGNNVMIGGFILGADNGNTRLAIRGIGPSLKQAGLSDVLEDPTLSLRDANGTQLIFNDNWMDDSSQADALTANGLAPTSREESGIFTTLPPGAFTVILAGKNGDIGVGLVEVYNLQ
jgi:hypothetical protein